MEARQLVFSSQTSLKYNLTMTRNHIPIFNYNQAVVSLESPNLILTKTELKTKQALPPSKTTSVQLLSGCLSGFITCISFQPLDLLKTLQQQQTKVAYVSSPNTSKDLVNANINRASARQLVQLILKQDGLLGLWRGTVPTIFRSVPGTGLYFLIFEKLKLGINFYKKDRPNCSDQLVCGSVARSLAGFVLMPASVIKTRVESNIYLDTNIRQASRSIFQSRGMKGFFAGAGATALRDAPYAGIYVYFYQLAKGLTKNGSVDSPSLSKNLLAGIGAGFAATLATHPFDVIKTRMQLDKTAYPTVFSALKSLAGPDLGRGLMMRLARKSLSSGIAWAGYEQLVHWATLNLISN